MNPKVVARLEFSPELRDRWPTKVLTAEAWFRRTADEASNGPWSLRAQLWAPPDERGRAYAWISVLSPETPFDDIEIRSPFSLTLGRTVVAQCVILTKPHSATPEQGSVLKENDFLEAPDQAVRRAA